MGMGDYLYIICEDGDYIVYGKEIETYANHVETVAALMFLIEKLEFGKHIFVCKHGLHEWHENRMKRDVSQEWLGYAQEELER
jgi:hypothetical protein